MDEDKYERCPQNPYGTIALVEHRINELAKTINTIRDYENPYKYITFMDSYTSKQLTIEITPNILTLPNEVIQNQIAKMGNKSPIIQSIFSKYSILDHEKQYNLSKDITLETKINIIYAESIKYSRNYCEYSLPHEYAQVFRENGYNNIYEKVKDELLCELNDLVGQKIELLTKK